MTEAFHRRSASDLDWQETKRKVRERDKCRCRLCQVLTTPEYKESWDNCDVKGLFKPTDCAHVDAVSIAPSEVYNIDNIFFLCRRHHSSIDNLINPVTNTHMSPEERWYWWWRIKMRRTDKYDENIDYEEWYRTGYVPESQKREQKNRSLEDILNY